ncbi:hypothetical protein [Paraburkholderia fungorum]|uniref:hypothetical protein n=1 Tax=Paraburkholderia fungorum TaxID=134537 RepID=UPI003D6AA109
MAKTPKQITDKSLELAEGLKPRWAKLHAAIEEGNLKKIRGQAARLHLETAAAAKEAVEFLGGDVTTLSGGIDKNDPPPPAG